MSLRAKNPKISSNKYTDTHTHTYSERERKRESADDANDTYSIHTQVFSNVNKTLPNRAIFHPSVQLNHSTLFDEHKHIGHLNSIL